MQDKLTAALSDIGFATYLDSIAKQEADSMKRDIQAIKAIANSGNYRAKLPTRIKDEQCGVCGDYDCDIPRECESGDGV